MSAEIADRHAELSRRLIEQANYELHHKGDRVQASEKASGAVAQAVKAIGEDRQWRHGSHNLRRQIVSIIAAEYGKPELALLQQYADHLHDNFYEDRLHDWQLQQDLAILTELLNFLLEARENGPNPNFVPTEAQQRTIERLRIPEDEAAANPLLDYPPPLPPFVPPEE